ncbi:MAG: DUF58 domain-containing protein [Planctomycetes bacterium]|nr:DUF58 domain-containing protein [Planctomycetota bacterium]
MPFRSRPLPMPPPASEGLAVVLQEVRRIEAETRRLVTDVLAGGYRSTFRGAGIEFADVREYVEGDEPRRIDWAVTARMGRPFVKRFVEERELTVVFAVDTAPSLDAGFGAWSPRQAAARFCALLGLLAIANNDRIGLCAGAAEALRFVPPKKGAGHVLRVVRDTLCLRPDGPAAPLGALARATGKHLRRRTIVFLLSDFLGFAAGGATAAALQAELARAARRHDLIAVWLQPPEWQAPPRRRWLGLAPDGGSLARVDAAHGPVRALLQERWRALRAQVLDGLGRAHIDCIEMPLGAAPDPQVLAAPLQRFFRMRELREARR